MKPARPKRTRQRAAAKATVVKLSDESLAAIETAMAYTFKDKRQLVRAFTHPSALTGAEARKHSNQRLEFLGDRVLGLVIAERLIERHPTEREGALAPRLNRLVKKGACAEALRHLGLEGYTVMAEGDLASGGRDRESTQGDVCEAMIGAVYLDGGLSPARKLIERAWAPQFKSPQGDMKDAKTRLQEWAQQHGHGLPVYAVADRDGPDHAPIFTIEVSVPGGGDATGRAKGSSKQDAERDAAAKLLDKLGA